MVRSKRLDPNVPGMIEKIHFEVPGYQHYNYSK